MFQEWLEDAPGGTPRASGPTVVRKVSGWEWFAAAPIAEYRSLDALAFLTPRAVALLRRKGFADTYDLLLHAMMFAGRRGSHAAVTRRWANWLTRLLGARCPVGIAAGLLDKAEEMFPAWTYAQ